MQRRRTYLWAYVLILLSSVSRSPAQGSSLTDSRPQNKPISSFSIGVEGGWINNVQSGSFQNTQGGKGNSAIGTLFFEYDQNEFFSFGMRIGLDHKLTSAASIVTEAVTVVPAQSDSVLTGTLNTLKDAEVSATYFYFAPYFKFSPFGRGAFIQIAPELGILTGSNLTSVRKITDNKATLSDGEVISNVRFYNGTQEETLYDGEIQDVKHTRIALFLTAGYDIPVFGNFLISPQASYNLALTNISTAPYANNWKISSFAFTLGLRYGM
ncbi:MAG: hypothetical protein ACHQM6_02610 [Candidatus Kapaibacterium sp.]